ncbi:hypothetical protein DRP53_04645 [candidate division WOR-3 bacterium]|uniref:Tetratricopeptide repeat protein n=1 Tax=candidate division WOR-3 bacterium TaxID=2052148 RepID=A0A660SIP7_UNCW3|nr:MAG: hypothetical protein DRP53_04645 [candidate division WOR-3 bacterium]
MLRLEPVKYLIVFFCGCAYINTFYNAKRYFREGVKVKQREGKLTNEAKDLFDKSIEKSAKVIKNYPDSRFVDDALYLMGRAYYEKGDYDRAIKKFEELRILFPESKFNIDGTYYKAMAYLKTGSHLLAIKSFEMVEERWREEANFQIGIAHMKRGAYQTAVDRFKRFLSDFPKSRYTAKVMYNLGECYGQMGEIDSMVYYFNQFLKKAHTGEKTDSIRIEIARRMGEHQRIEDAIGIIGDTNKDSLLLIKADLLIENGRYDDAKAILNMIIESETLATIGDAYYRLAIIKECEGDFPKALSFYDSAIGRATHQSYRIDAERRRTTLSKALELKKNPGEDPARALFLLAEIYLLNLKRPDLAIETYHAVYDSFPSSDFAPKALYAIGWVRENILGDSSGAAAIYDTLRQRYPETIFAQEVADEGKDSQ